MKQTTKTLARTLLLAATTAFFLNPTPAEACTGITLHAKNGDVVYGRTLEWGTFDLLSRLSFFPRGYQYKGDMPADKPGLRWTGRFGVAGIDGLEKECFFDGMNEKGLAGGLFYHPGISEYAEYTAENAKRALKPSDVLTFVLSTCSTIDEVRKALSEVVLVNIVEEAIGFPAPVHLIVTQQDGKQLVIEWVGKEVQFYDSKVGVLTNAPEYPWQMTNLRNYVNMSLKARPTIELNGVTLKALGGGSGMLGLPGDFTPPSRFVRAATFSAAARPVEDGEEALYELFRILDNFNVPLGSSEGEGAAKMAGLRSATTWTIGHDLANLRFLFHTEDDRMLQLADLRKVDFTSFDKPVHLPIDTGKQSIRSRMDEFAARIR